MPPFCCASTLPTARAERRQFVRAPLLICASRSYHGEPSVPSLFVGVLPRDGLVPGAGREEPLSSFSSPGLYQGLLGKWRIRCGPSVNRLLSRFFSALRRLSSSQANSFRFSACSSDPIRLNSSRIRASYSNDIRGGGGRVSAEAHTHRAT